MNTQQSFDLSASYRRRGPARTEVNGREAAQIANVTDAF